MNHSPQDTKYARRCPLYAPRYRSYRTAFTLIELLMVVAILGILAAVTLPSIQGHIIKAKEAAAKDNLRTLRQAIERYANDHDGIAPGYPDGDSSSDPVSFLFVNQLQKATNAQHQVADAGTAGYPFGPYVSEFPENPFNQKKSVLLVRIGQTYPVPTADYGWIYQPAIKKVKLDWPGTDSTGANFSDY